MAKYCPIRVFESGNKFTHYCGGSNCAWYSEEAQMCSISAIGNVLASTYVTACKESSMDKKEEDTDGNEDGNVSGSMS